MLLRFRVGNHASIRDEQEVSLIALDRHEDLAVVDVPGTDRQALPAAAIYGANASGKSNVIDALAFCRRVVVESHQRWLPDDPIPRRPFKLDEQSQARPSTFVTDFVLDGVRYEYGFGVTDSAVAEEWLYSWPEQRRRVLFEREDDGQVKYGTSFPSRRGHQVNRPRAAGLLLSAGAASDHPLLLPIYRWFRSGLYPALNHTFDERLSLTMAEFDGKNAAAARALIRFADVGVEDVKITTAPSDHFAEVLRAATQIPIPDVPTGPRERALKAFHTALSEAGPQILEDIATLDLGDPRELSQRLGLMHRSALADANVTTFRLSEESSGTSTWLGLIGPLLRALRDGAVLIVDELDAHLHPHLAARLIGMFQSPETNRRGAQLIFNTHDVTLMGRTTEHRLHRDQIHFADKDSDSGATRLYPLTEFARVRDGLDNPERWYLSGRLGAVPVFLDSLLADVAETAAG